MRSRRLRGGLGARMHVLDIEDASGKRRKVVLRRYRPGNAPEATPESARRESQTLELLENAGVLAPRCLLADPDGDLLGVPTLVLSYLRGGGYPLRVGADRLVAGLAGALLQVHAVTPDRFDLAWLPAHGRQGIRDKVERRRERALSLEPLSAEIWRLLDARKDSITKLPHCLVHEDYWPGNTVWDRGRLAGVIDWATAEVGDPRVDLAQCRLDLAISHGVQVADAFLTAYSEGAPGPLPDIWFFDLLYGLRALFYYESWLPGYHDFGLTHLTTELAGERLREFLQRTLVAAQSHP